MKIEQAIEIAERSLNAYKYMNEQGMNCEPSIMACEIALQAMMEKQERENPKPLTVSELRKMDGEPVWVAEAESWGVVSVDADGQFKNIPFVNGVFQDCNTSSFCWNVKYRNLHCYRSKQKEE